MENTVTIKLDEYLKLKEKAELNHEKIIELVSQKQAEYTKTINDIYKSREKSLETNYKYQKKYITSKIMDLTNGFGYLKSSELLKYIEEECY